MRLVPALWAITLYVSVNAHEEDETMIGKAGLLLVVSTVWLPPVFAQSGVGGPNKQQSYVGGLKAQTNPVVPTGRGGATHPTQSAVKAPKK